MPTTQPLSQIPPRHGPFIARNQSTGELEVDGFSVKQLAQQHGTPLYIYSLPAAVAQYNKIVGAFQKAFESANPSIKNFNDGFFSVHFAVKANCSFSVLKSLIDAGSGMDCVSANEVRRVLLCGCPPERVVLAGVGKTKDELRFAIEQKLGCINAENEYELELLQRLAAEMNIDPTKQKIRVALRCNPDVVASTHPSIATGHKGAKFGLALNVVKNILETRKERFPLLSIDGLHLHIGSQLGNNNATIRAVKIALDCLRPHHNDIKNINVGGGFPVPYDDHPDSGSANLPEVEVFADAVAELLANQGFEHVSVEPGRYIIARAGLLVTEVLYRKEQDGRRIAILDASMIELMRPALYQAKHACVHVSEMQNNKTQKDDGSSSNETTNDLLEQFDLVGPVCESTDCLGSAVLKDQLVKPGELLAFCTAGAYCSSMGGNYNGRMRPTELVVTPDGKEVKVARRRELFENTVIDEVL